MFMTYKPQLSIDNNVIIVAGFQGNCIVALPDYGAQAPKHAADTHQMHVYNRYSAFSWFGKGV